MGVRLRAEVLVHGVIPSIRRLRGLLPPGWRGAAAGALALTLPLTAAGLAVADSHHHAAHASARPTPSASPFEITPADIAASLGDLRDLRSFDKLAKKPQAAAPIRRLPHVDLLKVNVGGIPPVAAGAYVRAARHVAATDPGCGLKWWLVAGIGFVESGHAASGGSHAPGWNGIARPPILGPVLDGSGGFAAIRDTDNGVYDGNRRWDRAVGPMQFLPSTWRTWRPAANGRRANPQNIVAAADATARYLCASVGDLSTPHGMALAVFSYNHSFDYVRLVLSVGARYAGIDPASLGIDNLPTDKQYRKHRRQQARHRHGAATTTSSGTKTGTTTASKSPAPAATSSPSPSPSPSSGGGGVVPQPTASPTLPVPTLGPGLP